MPLFSVQIVLPLGLDAGVCSFLVAAAGAIASNAVLDDLYLIDRAVEFTGESVAHVGSVTVLIYVQQAGGGSDSLGV